MKCWRSKLSTVDSLFSVDSWTDGINKLGVMI